MTRVRVVWQEVVTYNQVLEVDDDFNPNDEMSTAIEDAICDQANFLHVDEVSDREVISVTVLPK